MQRYHVVKQRVQSNMCAEFAAQLLQLHEQCKFWSQMRCVQFTHCHVHSEFRELQPRNMQAINILGQQSPCVAGLSFGNCTNCSAWHVQVTQN